MKTTFMSTLLFLALICYTLNSSAQTVTKLGTNALANNTLSGVYNTGIGYYSLKSNTSGYRNTGIGAYALLFNTTGNYNTATGYKSLYSNTLGLYNSSYGAYSLLVNKNGSFNTAYGVNSLLHNTEGSYNTAIGNWSLSTNNIGSHNTAIGYWSLIMNGTGSNNTAIGYKADVLTSDLINASAIGYRAIVDKSNKVRIGNTSVTSIGGQVGWTTYSDGRFKKDIRENVPGLAFINTLRPVTYSVNVKGTNEFYNKGRITVSSDSILITEDKAGKAETDKSEEAGAKITYNGFVAQEVEIAAKKLNFEFSGVDKPESKDGLYGLRYDNFVAPLVKAVQELSKMNDAKDAKIDDLIKRIEKLESIKSLQPSITKIVSLNDATLEQNIPNPFKNTTTINYTLPEKFTSAKIIIVDQSEKVLKQINVSGIGKGTLKLDANSLSSTAYNYSLIVDGHLIATKKMVLFK